MFKNCVSEKIMVICLLAFLLAPVFTAFATDIDVLVCPEGCGALASDQYISKEIKRIDPDLTFHPKVTVGYLYNLVEMGRNSAIWKNTIFAINDDMLTFAPQGGKHPFTKFITEPVKEKFRLLYGFYWGLTGHFFITLNPNLKKISDLKGKKIGLGLITQSDWGLNPTIDLEYGYGITAENTELFYLGPAKLPEPFLNGELDAIVAALGTDTDFKEWFPGVIFRDLKRSAKKLYYIGQEPGMTDQLNEKLNASYIEVTVPAGTLPGQTEPLLSITDRDLKACQESFPEDLAYRVVMAAAKIGPIMRFNVGIWEAWSPEMMVAGLSEENTHPGAIRAFQELGWWELRKKFKPAILPK